MSVVSYLMCVLWSLLVFHNYDNAIIEIVNVVGRKVVLKVIYNHIENVIMIKDKKLRSYPWLFGWTHSNLINPLKQRIFLKCGQGEIKPQWKMVQRDVTWGRLNLLLLDLKIKERNQEMVASSSGNSSHFTARRETGTWILTETWRNSSLS